MKYTGILAERRPYKSTEGLRVPKQLRAVLAAREREMNRLESRRYTATYLGFGSLSLRHLFRFSSNKKKAAEAACQVRVR